MKGVLHISGDGLRVVEEETKVNYFAKDEIARNDKREQQARVA